MNQEIVPIGKDMGWLEARDAVADKGGLPSNVLHDHYLVETTKWEQLPSGYYGAWARELLIYPAKNKQFHKGEDVVDACEDDEDREWVFPAKYIPKEALNKDKIGLFVDPQKVEITDDKVIIHPKKVIVLKGFLQNDEWGKVDPQTRVPLEVSKDELNKLPDNQKRKLWRISGAGVRPVARFVGNGDFRRVVNADFRHDNGLGVASVKGSKEQNAKNGAPTTTETFLSTIKPKGTIRITEEIRATMQLKIGQRVRVTIDKV